MTESDTGETGLRARASPAVLVVVGLTLTVGLARTWLGDLEGLFPWWGYLFLILMAIAMMALAGAVTIDPRPLVLRRAVAGAALVWLVLLTWAFLLEANAGQRDANTWLPLLLIAADSLGLAGLAATTGSDLDDQMGPLDRIAAVVVFAGAILMAAAAAVVTSSLVGALWHAITRGDPLDRLPWAAVAAVIVLPLITFAIASLASRRAAGGTFFAQAAANRRNGLLLLVTMVGVVAVTAEIIAISLTGEPVSALWAAGFAVLVGVVAAAAAHRFGSTVILDSAGARPADPKKDPVLLDVVRELSIAANIPMPKTYIIEDGSQNAFATGRDPEHASIAVTRGLLERMDREELQGVIGHELGHVRNLDTRYALYIAVFVGLVALITDGFLRLVVRGWREGTFFWKGRGKGAAGAFATGLLVGLFLLLVAALLRAFAPLASALVQAATSRQREFLADATSVEFTRNPQALERALASLANDHDTLDAANRGTQHLWFRNPVRPGSDRRAALLSTHPSLAARIDRLRALQGLDPLDPAAAAGAATET
jgi:heat shock protein HtpX